MKIQSDIQFTYDNFIRTKDGRDQVVVEAFGFHSSFDSEAILLDHFYKLHRLFNGLKREVQCVIVPIRQTLDDVKNQYLDITKGNLQHVGRQHTEAIFSYLKNSAELGTEENKFRLFLIVELGKQTLAADEEETFKENVKNLVNRATSFLTLRPDEKHVRESDLRKARAKAKDVYGLLEGTGLAFHPVTSEQMSFLIPWIFNLGIGSISEKPGWFQKSRPVKNKRGEVIARIPYEEDVLNLQLTGIENPKDRRHLVLHQTDDNGQNLKTYVSFLQMTKMPTDIVFPEVRWLEALHDLSFSVGVSMKMTYQNVDKRLAKLRIKKSNLEDQSKHLAEYGEGAGMNVYEGIANAEDIIAHAEKDREGSYLMSNIFAVHAPDYETLNRRIDDLKDKFSGMGMKLNNTYGLQLRSLLECLPGSRRYVTEFIQDADVNAVASSFFGVRRDLGDPYGFFYGVSDAGEAVFQIPGLAASGKGKRKAIATIWTGETGAGKSMSANDYLYESVLFGAKVLLLDPKNERRELCHWDEKLTELGQELNFISFDNRKEDAGIMDPFAIFDNRQDAKEVARGIITYLLDIKFKKDMTGSTLISRALTEVAKRQEPSIRFVKDELRRMATGDLKDSMTPEDHLMAKKLANILEQFEEIAYAQLIFGERDKDNAYSLDFNNQLNVLSVANLQLPDKKTAPEDYTEENTVAIAILYSLTAYMKKFMRMFADDVTIIAIDEAWNFFRNSAGERLIDSLFREGRVLLSPIFLMTQNLKDIPENLWGQIGSAFCFRTDNDEEIAAIKRYMRLDPNDMGFDRMIRNFEDGQCLVRDIYNRTGVMQVRVLQEHLYDAFDTSRDVTKRKELQPQS